jgi:hypothetical protein
LCEAQFIGRAASLHKKSPPMEGFFISLASGYPLHHPRRRRFVLTHSLASVAGGSATIPLATRGALYTF